MNTTNYRLNLYRHESIQVARDFVSFTNCLENVLNQYRGIMQHVADEAVKSGAVHDALLAFIERIDELLDKTKGIGEEFQSRIEDLKAWIISTDRCLYKGALVTKWDFSSECFNELLSCVENPDTLWNLLTDGITDFFHGFGEKVITFFDKEYFDSLLQLDYVKLLDYYDVTRGELIHLFDKENEIDQAHGGSTGPFYAIYLTLNSILKAINVMAETIQQGKGKFTAKNVKRRLSNAFSELNMYYAKAIAIPKLSTPVSVDEIKRFTEISFAATLFCNFRAISKDFLDERSGWDEKASLLAYNLFEMGKTTFIEGESYNQVIKKKQILNLLKGHIVDRSDRKNFDERVDEMRTLLKRYKEFGKVNYDNNNADWKETKKVLDKAGDILKYGGAALDFFSELFVNYSNCLDYLNSLKRNNDGNEDMIKAISDIEAELEKTVIAELKKASKIAAGYGYDAVKAKLEKILPMLEVLSTIEKTIDITGKLTDWGPQSKALYNALNCIQLNDELDRAYVNAIAKIRQADPSDANYAELAKDVRNCFELHKKNTIDMFNYMAEASLGSMKSYYRYCAQEADKITMRNSVEPELLTFSEYYNVYE